MFGRRQPVLFNSYGSRRRQVVPRWLVLMLVGLLWLLVFQLGATGLDDPTWLGWMADLGPWNYAIAFAFMISGLLLTMRWR